MTVREINIQTGEETQRQYTEEEKKSFESQDNKTHLLMELRSSDAGMARVAEDVIGALISNGLLKQEDLPNSVIEKLKYREELRNQLKKGRKQ